MSIKLKSLATKIISNIGATLVGILLTFVSVRLITEHYNQGEYGIWVIATSLVAWYLVFDFGFIQSFQNYAVKSRLKEDLKNLSAGFYGVTFILLVAGIPIFFAISAYANSAVFTQIEFRLVDNNYSNQLYFLYFLLICGITASLRASGSIYRSRHITGLINYNNILRGTIPILILFFYSEKISISLFLVIIGTLYLCIDLFFYFYCIRLCGIKYISSVNDKLKVISQLSKSSKSFFVYQIGYHAIELAPTLYVAALIGLEEAGKLNPSLRIYGIFNGLVISAVVPLISYFSEVRYSGNFSRSQFWIIERFYLIALGGILMGITYAFISPIFIGYWLGVDYVYEVYFYIIFGIAIAVNIPTSIITAFMVGIGEQKKLAFIYGISGLLSMVFSVAMTHYLGTLGVLTAILIANFMILAMLVNFMVRYKILNNSK
jgi:O-antigen/teichoic acid export membrane protein